MKRKRIIREWEKKTDWKDTCLTGRAVRGWMTASGRKQSEPQCSPDSSVSHKGRAEKLQHITLTLSTLLHHRWSLGFWNYTIDELEHFTKKEKKEEEDAEMGQAGVKSTLKQADLHTDPLDEP